MLLGLVLVGYGLRAGSLGFFWDDWPFLWFYHSLGPSGIAAGLAEDRPFLSFIYTLTLSTLGNSPLAWQIFGLLARWACCLGLWWALLQAWPRSGHKVFWAAALFAVYPGFTQQWIVVIYGQAFVLFAMFLFSLGLSLWLVRIRARGLALGIGTAAALALSAFTMFSTEYFFGLELLRPMLLWLMLVPQGEKLVPLSWRGLFQRLVRVLRQWWPYLALMIVFVIWRGFIHTFPGKSLTVVEGMQVSPLNALGNLALTILEDFSEANLVAWGQIFGSKLLGGWASGFDLRLVVLMLVVGVLGGIYLLRLRPDPRQDSQTGEESQESWAAQAIGIGLLSFFTAGWPFWITGLPMQPGFPQDRYALPLAVGGCLLLAGLVDAAGRSLPVKAAVIALVLALAVGFHSQMAQEYRQDWENFKSFLWQMTWRAPEIQPGTLLLTDAMGLRFYEDDSLTAPINWTYDPENHSLKMDALLYDLLVRQNSLTDLKPGVDVERNFRGKTFTGSTSQVLVVAYNPPGCLKILDPTYDSDLPGLPERVMRTLQLSNPAQWVMADTAPAAPPQEIFGTEPKHRWCYYYQKAALARQQGNWDEVVELAGQSIGQGIRPGRPQDQVEFLPFVEAYARVGRWDDAAQMTADIAFWAPEVKPALCSLWRRSLNGVDVSANDTVRRSVEKAAGALNCELP